MLSGYMTQVLYLLANIEFVRLLEKPYRWQAQFWTRIQAQKCCQGCYLSTSILRSDRVRTEPPHSVEMVIKLA